MKNKTYIKLFLATLLSLGAFFAVGCDNDPDPAEEMEEAVEETGDAIEESTD